MSLSALGSRDDGWEEPVLWSCISLSTSCLMLQVCWWTGGSSELLESFKHVRGRLWPSSFGCNPEPVSRKKVPSRIWDLFFSSSCAPLESQRNWIKILCHLCQFLSSQSFTDLSMCGFSSAQGLGGKKLFLVSPFSGQMAFISSSAVGKSVFNKKTQTSLNFHAHDWTKASLTPDKHLNQSLAGCLSVAVMRLLEDYIMVSPHHSNNTQP